MCNFLYSFFFFLNRRPKEVCGIPRCNDFNLWLYVILPVVGAVILATIILVLVCVRRRHKKPGLSTMSTLSAGSPRSLVTGAPSSNHNYSEMEMNALIPQTLQCQPQ